ncbi:MAG: chalcone isomerase family protein [Gammaproteobacteria bacterium]|nr:chalcone isomerase family protein [Gammaproteobacteria bacterium]MBU2287151.1 chalcone isomerase family protein [Gammaproteobacteria bacterium]MBU2408080.1 chalcone isomerase family protein [Gammaproteobacteria bacterium]
MTRSFGACGVLAMAMLACNVDAQANLPPPIEMKSAIPDAQRAGATRFTVWGFDVYDASLWVGPGFRADRWDRAPFALELRYLRAFDGRDIAQRSLDEMTRLSPVPAPQARTWLDDMKAAFPDVKKGDRLVGIYEPGTGARFFHNGVATRTVRDADFAKRFFGIWLERQTSEPAMREALLAPVAR